MYADDNILFSPPVKGLQNLVIQEWCLSQIYTVCKHILSNKVKYITGAPSVKLGTKSISFVKQITYLGHIIYHDL